MIGVALLGLGYAGMIQLKGWKEISNARVVGAYDPRPERRAAVETEFGIPTFADPEELLSARGVDAVDIATPPECHAEDALRAIARNKAVLCQKPFAVSVDDARSVVEASEAAGVRLMCNENFIFRPWFSKARELIRAGELGRLTYLTLSQRNAFLIPGSERTDGSYRGSPEAKAEDRYMLLESGPHAIEVVRFLFGDPTSVYTRTLSLPKIAHGDVMATVLFGYPDRVATFDLSWITNVEPSRAQPHTMVVEGSEGTLRLAETGTLTLVGRNGTVRTIESEIQDYYQRSWTAALAHFADALESGNPFITPARHGLRTTELLFAAYRSAEENRPIDLPVA